MQRALRCLALICLCSIPILTECGGGDSGGPQILASKLAITVQPALSSAGAHIAPAVVVEVQSFDGDRVTSGAHSVTLSISNGTGTAGAVLGGTVTRAAASGVATFSDLTIDKASAGYTLTATTQGLTSATSSAFDITAGAAAALAITTQPTVSSATLSIAPAIQVAIRDSLGNPVTSAANTVTMAITANTGTPGAVLGGTLSQAAATGVATFSDLTINSLGTGYTLTATATGLTSDTTAAFNVAGLISGTISLIAAPLSLWPPDQLRVAREGSRARALTNLRGLATGVGGKSRLFEKFTGVMSPSSPRPSRSTANELLVTYRAAGAGALLRNPRGMSVAALQGSAQTIRQAASLAVARFGAVIDGISPAISAARIRVPDPSLVKEVRAALAADPAVAKVEPNPVIYQFATGPVRSGPRLLSNTRPNDPLYPAQAWNYEAIDLNRAWGTTTGSSSVIVAVIDDGIRFDDPDISPNLTNDGFDFASSFIDAACTGSAIDLSGDGNGYDPDPTVPVPLSYDALNDCYQPNTAGFSHGLHTAGTIGAVGNDGAGVTGVNWTIRIRPIRIFGADGGSTAYDVAQGILYAAGLPADNGLGGTVQAPSRAPIISMSFGGPSDAQVVHDAITGASVAGSLLVASAGNDASNVPNYPAAYPEVVSVSAIGPGANLASYTSFGPTVDIAAPGGDFAAGAGDPSFGVYSTAWNFATNTSTYLYLQGTSMAAPHVSGVAALLLAHEPGLTASQLRSRLLDFAIDYGVAGRDDFYGAGLVNARNSLTQTTHPAQTIRARLFNALTGATVTDVTATTGGVYNFPLLASGTYWVFAGQDEDGDQQIGAPTRRWSAAGSTAVPATYVIGPTGSRTASFTLGYGYESEPNDTLATANVLPVGGYLYGVTSSTTPDFFTVLIPTSGQYSFFTEPYRGACGYAINADTILNLYDSNGVQLLSNDDIDLAGGNLCSRIVTTLTAGRYYLKVYGFNPAAGGYHVRAVAG